MNTVRACVRGIVVAIGVCVVPAQAPAQFQPTVTPILYCKVHNEANGTMDVYLGYASSYATAVTIPADTPENMFFPEPLVRNQPSTFLPGIHPRVFVTHFEVDAFVDRLAWLLDGNSVTALAFLALQECPHPMAVDGAEGSQGPPGPLGPAGPAGPGATVRRVTTSGSQSTALAACAADEALVSGGGSCSTTILGSAPSGNGWSVRCKGKAAATATALCIRK